MSPDAKKLVPGDIQALTSFQAGKLRGIEFAGFLVKEEKDAIFVADPQGTWMIPRESLMQMGPWECGDKVPPDLRAVGNPVRVTLKDDSTFYEIRPWRVSPGPRSTNAKQSTIFSLPDQNPPLSVAGLEQLQALENQLIRQLGFNPDLISDPTQFPGGFVANSGSSATGDQGADGGSTAPDTDGDF